MPSVKEPPPLHPFAPEVSDEEIVARVVAGESELFELLLRRHNQRVYRVARAVLGNDAQAEDLAQEAWVRAYEHLAEFEGRARFSTWLTRIVLYEGWARSRNTRRFEPIGDESESSEEFMSAAPDPESRALGSEMRGYLESAMDSIPENYRVVLVLRDVEELSTAEAAETLGLTENAVKIRLHRARAMVRRDLAARVGDGAREAFPFLGGRCDEMVRKVMLRVRGSFPPPT
ncbi:MAG: RNA polymerase sigma factor [Acidobacteriota bacterium]|nr:RNA polymerase sigma factor [Acidobacteriota bacterium]